MTRDLRVTLVQADLLWHDPEGNRRKFSRLMEPVTGKTDVIVLPEMFTTGFTMAAQKVAEPVDGPTMAWLRECAARTDAAVTGSIVVWDGGRYFNRLIWMHPDGNSWTYDKRHLFRMAHEQEHYSAGSQRLVVPWRGWRVSPLVCYDLRFPVWSRNRIGTDLGYELLIYVANWPERRRYAWQTLLQARAIENLCYCIGVNRVGQDGEGVAYTGDSTALDYLGQAMTSVAQEELVTTVTLNRGQLEAFRTRFPAHLDADSFDIDIDPR